MNSTRQKIVGRLPEYRELSKMDLSGLPKEALLATIKDLAESLVALITTPDSETIRAPFIPEDFGDSPGTTHCVDTAEGFFGL